MSGDIQESEIVSSRGHLLASTLRPSEIFVDVVGRVQTQPTSVLDIGAGNARLTATITDQFPGASIIALDIDHLALPESTNTPTNVDRLSANALQLPIKPRSIGLALAVNTAHEICDSPDEMRRLELFRDFISGVATVVSPGGEIIFIDGVMPDNSNTPINLYPKTQDAEERFNFFANTYKGKPLAVTRISNRNYNLTLSDLTAFVTKILYLDSKSWEDEKRQLYPFLSQDQIMDVFHTSGFKIEEITHPTVRRNLDLLKSGYEVVGLDIDDFPPVQVALRAIRLS